MLDSIKKYKTAEIESTICEARLWHCDKCMYCNKNEKLLNWQCNCKEFVCVTRIAIDCMKDILEMAIKEAQHD